MSNEPDTPRECIDCGQPATVISLDAYGPGKPGDYCTVCFIANNAPGVDHPIQTSVYGEVAEVTTLLQDDTCDNCGVHILDSIQHGPEFLAADAEWQAFLRTPASMSQPQSVYRRELEWLRAKYPEASETALGIMAEHNIAGGIHA